MGAWFEPPHLGRLRIGRRWYLLCAGPKDGALRFVDEVQALQTVRRVDGGHAALRAALVRGGAGGPRLDGDETVALAARLLLRRGLSLVPLPETALPSFLGREEPEPAPRRAAPPQWSGDIEHAEQPRWRGEVGVRSTRWRADITVRPGAG
jgi:hypothetical protein